MTARQLPRGNPVRRLGRVGKGYTPIPNDLIREGIAEIGSNAYAVFSLLLSHSDGWTTSSALMSAQLGFGRDRRRVDVALTALQKAKLVVIRDYVREGGGRVFREYVLHADGRRFTDAETDEWSAPITLSPNNVHENHAGSDPC